MRKRKQKEKLQNLIFSLKKKERKQLTVKIINADSEFVFSAVDGFGDSLIIFAVKSHVGVGRLVPVCDNVKEKRKEEESLITTFRSFGKKDITQVSFLSL